MLILVAAGAHRAAAGGLSVVWELDLQAWNTRATDKFPVMAVSFSPDGRQIAFSAVNTLSKEGKPVSRLFVANIGAGPKGVREFDTPAGGRPPAWSPSGRSVFANGTLVHLDTGARCADEKGFGFIAESELIGEVQRASSAGPARIEIVDPECHPVREWSSAERWDPGDISVDRQLLLGLNQSANNLLLRAQDGGVVRRWPAKESSVADAPGGAFADSGRALCGLVGGGIDDVPEGTNVRCWETDTGKLIGYGPANRSSGLVAVSVRSSRVIFAEMGSLPLLGLIPGINAHPFLDAIVWDFLSGKTLASWRPAIQNYTYEVPPVWRVKEGSKYAISADGKLIAEAGNGKITVYRVGS